MLVFSADRFELPLPAGHRFPIAKYRLLREAVEASRLVPPENVREPAPATDEELLRVHDADWVARVVGGRLEPGELRRLGFPWSPELVERSRRSVGGTLGACRSALERGGGVHLAGGTHHAFADRGEGYCVFNDVAVAIRTFQGEGRIVRALVVDCDVHQGDGTASLFRGDPSVFTLSLHGRRNYPLRKEESDLDVALEDGTGDEAYLAALDDALEALPWEGADLVVYLAGADAYAADRLGRLALSAAGLAERDRRVLERCRRRAVPAAVVMGGGYAPRLEEVVGIHLRTVATAVKVLGKRENVACATPSGRRFVVPSPGCPG